MKHSYFDSAVVRNGRYKLVMAFTALFFLLSGKVDATHSAGADLTYTWVSGNTFQVTVSFYRDCAGVAAPNSITLNARSSSCNKNQNYTLNMISGTGQEITFPCRSVTTICTNSSSTYAGYQQYIYRGNITLPQQCADWVMSFYVCCRNCAITTLNNPCNDNMYVEATLNNVIAPQNSSPQFTNIPVAFLCVNQSFTYNHGVIDLNGDSLVYSFITPKTYNTGNGTIGTVTFNGGYSANNPLTSSPAVNLNSGNGDITMFPTINGEIGVTAILVKEYRNGVLIGSVIRDMQFLTKVCNPNLLPTASGINGSASYSAVVCPGNTISFAINTADPNAADTVSLTWNNVIPGATFTTVGAQFPVGTFTWTPSQADARSQPYSFIVTVRDNACPTNGSQTFSFTISVPQISASITSPVFNGYEVACNGAGTGSASVLGNGGTTPYTYLWIPSGQTTQTAINLSAGNYTATVTDANGCTSSDAITLTQPPAAVSSGIGSSTNVNCNGGSDGTATATASGGVGTYTYSWNPTSQTTASISGLNANSYTVTVTDLNGCTSQSTVIISEPPVLSGAISSYANVSCQGNSNGTIDATASGGTPPYTHHWSNGATVSAITGLAPGTYRDTIRDSKNCQIILTQVITEPGASVGIPASSVVTTNVLCNGGFNGTASVAPAGGTVPYTITWSNGDIGNSADSLTAGNYQVTIVDANGCTFDSTVTITEPALLTSTFVNFSTTPGGTNIACNGDSTGKVRVNVIGGTVPYTFNWSNGVTIDSISGVPAGAYSVTITDLNGCTFSDTTDITEPSVLRDSLVKQDVVCKGESSGWIKVIAYGGSPAYTYSWSPGLQTTDSIGGLPVGFYQVTMTDLNGCSRIDTVTLVEPDTLVPLITAITFYGDVQVRCYGDSSATVSVDISGGTPPYTFQWNNGLSNDTLYNLPAGTVSVFVRDVNGCSITGSRTLTQPTPFMYGTTIHDPKCFGDSSGWISLNAGGSTPPYSYAWSNGSTTDSIGGLTSGSVYVVLSDANNCTDSVGFVLANPDSLSSPVATSAYLGYNISCNGGNNGFINLSVSGGTGPYTYSWSGGQTTDSIGALQAGTYSVTILDTNGCRKDTSVVLDEPPALSVSVSADVFSGGFNVSCFGYNDGTAHANVSGGVPGYQYTWNNGDVADSAMGLYAGTYNLTVTDSNGCTATASVTLSEPAPVTLTASFSDYNGFSVPCNGDSLACVTVNLSGGATPYNYVWDIQDTINAPSICNLAADTIGLNVTDANGCSIDTAFVLTEPGPRIFTSIISNYMGYNVQCNGFSNGAIDLTSTGGVGPYTFLWNTADTTEDLSGIGAGTYQVAVVDVNGCPDTLSFTLSEPPAITDSISSTNTTCNLSNGDATVNVLSGLTPFTYLWNPGGQNSATISNLAAGSYNVTITDSVGCIHSDTVTITVIPTISASISSQTDNLCFGYATGTATFSFSGGTPPFSYQWTNGDTGLTADSLAAGLVTAQITDANGCIGIASATINAPAQIQPAFTVTDASCNGVNDGSVSTVISGGTAPYTVSWSNGDTGSLADSLGGGYVVAIITDNNSCIYTDSADVNQPNALSANITSVTNILCNGGNNGSASVSVPTGGTPPYAFIWSNGDSGQSADSLTAGVATVTITDQNGCASGINVTITEPALLTGTISHADVTCYGYSDGQASVTVSGGTPGYSLLWSPGNEVTDSISNIPGGTYSVTVTDNNNCTALATVLVNEPALLTANAGADQAGCNPEFGLEASLDAGQTGQWSVVSGTASFTNSTSPVSMVSNLIDGGNTLVWTISNGTCSGSDTITVTLQSADLCDLELPSGFSPNGDGKNDFYIIHGIDRYPENSFKVFNRWGNEVFSIENFTNKAWSGQNKSGDVLPEGTYFVILEIRNSGIRLNTYVDLRR